MQCAMVRKYEKKWEKCSPGGRGGIPAMYAARVQPWQPFRPEPGEERAGHGKALAWVEENTNKTTADKGCRPRAGERRAQRVSDLKLTRVERNRPPDSG
jgi:hypothetical protein